MNSPHPHETDSANRRANDTTSPTKWPELIPITSRVLPKFPVDALPPALANWVSEESEATQTPVDMAALLALAVCAATLAKRVTVQAWPGWSEPCNLYVVAILEPANRKSAVFSDATRPLRQVETRLREDSAESIAEELSDYRQTEKRLAKLERTAAEQADATKRDDAKQEARDIAKQLATWIKPEEPTLIVDDATSEKLAIMLQANGERLASMSAEGGVFDLMAGKYSSGATDINVYLMGHSGDSISVNRVGRPPVQLDSPAITMALAIQPEVIRGIAKNSAFRGRGLLGRFLYAIPTSWIGRRRIATAPVPESVTLAYSHIVKSLASIKPDEDGRPHEIKLSDQAVVAFKAFCERIETELGSGSLQSMKDWGGKLAGATLRIAAIIHCAGRHAGTSALDQDISAETIEAAQRIAWWAIPHADSALDLLGSSVYEAQDDAEYLLRWLKNNRQGEPTFDRRDAQRHGQRRFNRMQMRLDSALDWLEATNHIAKLHCSAIGGRVPYEVSPRVIGARVNPETHQCGDNDDNHPVIRPKSEEIAALSPLSPVIEVAETAATSNKELVVDSRTLGREGVKV